MNALIYDEAKKPHIVDINSEHSLLTMESHIHPLHVIINAHLKFCDWDPPPSDDATIRILDDIREIWEVWSSMPPTEEYMSYGHKDRADHSSLGLPSEAGSRSRSRKRSDQCDDDGSSRNSKVSKRERRPGATDGHECQQLMDATPSLDLSSSSGNSSDSECMGGGVQTWRDTLAVCGTFSPPPDLGPNGFGKADAGIGSPKVTGYKSWEPRWDRRWVDTSLFSSNDWAYYRRSCDLTGEYTQ
jgi:hypothetical protein